MTTHATGVHADNEAAATEQMLTNGVMRRESDPIERHDVFDVERGTSTAYMLGGGGPTTHAVAVPDPMDPDGVLILVTSHHMGQRGHRVIDGPLARAIADRLAEVTA